MMKKENHNLQTDAPLHAGAFIQLHLTEIGMTKKEFAVRLQRPFNKVLMMLNGKKEITPQTALGIQKILKLDAQVILNLQTFHSLQVERNKSTIRNLDIDIALLEHYDYGFMARNKWIPETRNKEEKVENLRVFFNVTTLQAVNNLALYNPQFRQVSSGEKKISKEAIAIWLRRGEILAADIKTAPYNEKKLREILPEIRKMTTTDPTEFFPRLVSILADCGIALVVEKYVRSSYVSGATFWLSGEKAVVMLSLRGKYADSFWFSLFHELAHVILHKKGNVLLNYTDQKMRDEFDAEADEFASNLLIPKKLYNAFVKKNSFYSGDIKMFAENLEIDPGIIVGRLTHNGYLNHGQFNNLRTQYEFSDE